MSNFYTNVRDYSDSELLNRVQELPSFKGFPRGYWILGVQSQEDEFNVFDDKFYLYKNTKFIDVAPGTTNAGLSGLLHYQRYNRKGVAVVKTDEWYYDLWKYGFHRGKMPALKQVSPIKYFRDWNRNRKVEEIGPMYKGIIGINFHTVLYDKIPNFYRKYIYGWSTGCQVVNHVGKYYDFLDKVKHQDRVTYCLIKEF